MKNEEIKSKCEDTLKELRALCKREKLIGVITLGGQEVFN